MIHGHEVLNMMEGNVYADKLSLVAAIKAKFGADAKFYTCSADNMSAEQLVDFLVSHGKFKPAGPQGHFTVDTTQVCDHDNH